jgi:hypothetical protein
MLAPALDAPIVALLINAWVTFSFSSLSLNAVLITSSIVR